MSQSEFFTEEKTLEKFDQLSREELVEYVKLQKSYIEALKKLNDEALRQNEELSQKRLFVDEQYITIKNEFYGKSSEKKPAARDRKKNRAAQKSKKKIRLPSERYPNAPLIEREVEFETAPDCSCCGYQLKDSGMTENSEHLTVIPAKYLVVRVKRHKYRCEKCHGDLRTAPAPPRIQPGSSYSDEMVVDVAMSKYCDLIPIERYASIAGRGGLEDLPPQSLIDGTHALAEFVKGAYQLCREEALEAKVLHADETPHRMLENHGDKSWYLWGFSTKKSSYFEIHNTRSGDVSSDFLKGSCAEFLVSDVFSGYSKTTKVVNAWRSESNPNAPPLRNVYCNAHARRKFKQAADHYPQEAQVFIDLYEKVYRLDGIKKRRACKCPKRAARLRAMMRPLFKEIREQAMALVGGYSSKSAIIKACNYFLKNEEGLTLFLNHLELPIDNNAQERLLRNPVIGRKTWYGTHSLRGASTAAILFSLVESCKLNSINPRKYFKALVDDLHQGKTPFTPFQYKSSISGVC